MTDFYDLYERQQNQRRERMDKFWICYVEHTDGGRHHRHYSLTAAQRETERLARLPDMQGQTIYLFEYIGKCQVGQQPVIWEVPR